MLVHVEPFGQPWAGHRQELLCGRSLETAGDLILGDWARMLFHRFST